jgi:hypothetical protein
MMMKKKCFRLMYLRQNQFLFCKTSFGLYAYNPFEESNNYQFITTMEENRKFYTERQFQRAKKARELYYSLRTPSLKDFKTMVTMNFIKNNPISLEDIKLAKSILAQILGALRERQHGRSRYQLYQITLKYPVS